MSDVFKAGGPAFPITSDNYPAHFSAPGMSLRDYFAGQALVGILSCEALLMKVDERSDDATKDAASRYAYAVADAMLAERAKERAP